MKKLILFPLLCILLCPSFVLAVNNCTNVGNVDYQAPKYGNYSASFFGGYLDCGNDASLKISGTSISVEAWVKASTPSGGSGIVSKNMGSGWHPGYGLYLLDNGKICFGINEMWGGNEACTAFSYDGLWHYVVGTYDGSYIRIFADIIEGVPFAYTQPIAYNDDQTQVLGIGIVSGSLWSTFTGYIDEVAIYKVSLSSSVIASHYSSTNYQTDVTNTPGLMSYWKMDGSFVNSYVPPPSPSDSELLQQIKDVLDQIDAKAQAIQEVTAGSTAVDWNKTMSFVVGTLSSLAFVFASKMIL